MSRQTLAATTWPAVGALIEGAENPLRRRYATHDRVTAGFLIVVAVLLSAPAWAQSGQIVEYYHLDALGSVRVVTDQNAQVVSRHDFLPFGEEWNPPANAKEKKLFTGHERDAETGLDYFGARYYRPQVGRFTTIDPVYTWSENLTDPQRWNRYAYVRNSPLKYVDPDGRNPLLLQALQRIANSPIAQRVALWTSTQASSAWLWATRVFNSPGGHEAVQAAGEMLTGAQAPSGGSSEGIAVIGRYADHGPTCYTTLAKSPGAHFFETAEEIWRSMTPAARKAANMEFIQQVAAETWTVRSNLDLRTISSGALYDEIRELLRLGYTFSKDGKSMLPPKR